MIDGNRKLSEVTLDEFIERSKEDKTVTTDELCEDLKCSPAQIGVYGRAGMYRFRIKKNCWWKKASMNWVANDYQELLKKRRTRKIQVK